MCAPRVTQLASDGPMKSPLNNTNGSVPCAASSLVTRFSTELKRPAPPHGVSSDWGRRL